ncbi:IS1595 transposase [mine drainage metagenome]|uniref:IS1595 transposase n=2 Tax=mine drainage metagenome TaxID=410659 RepID=T0ZC51_9ZZZZ
MYYQCRACRHQTTLTSGTVFEGSKLPLTTWFLAMHLLTGSKTNMAALELKRHLGVCYDTAWKLKHDQRKSPRDKIMQTMTEREAPRQLAGFVQIDDAYLGGERNGGKPGRGSENKQPFVVAVATDETLEHPTFAVIEPVRSCDNASLTDWGQRRLAPDAEVFSDGLGCFRRMVELNHAHTVLETAGGRAATEVKGARWVNVVLGNVKRVISGCYHAMRQAKYDRRKSLFGMRGAIWPRRPTGSTAGFALPNCCRDWRARGCCASLGRSPNCAPWAIFMAERRR